MKRIASIIILSLAAAIAYGQTAEDAYMFSESHYEGTARTMAMGNAFTALGGDLGSFNINPAASAVAKYSQISITPALTFSTDVCQGTPLPDGMIPDFQNKVSSRNTCTGLSNIGLAYNWETGRKSGLKSISFGFVGNRSNTWNGNLYTHGINTETSFMGAVASAAMDMGLLGSDLADANAYDFMPWREVAAFQSGMISTFDQMDDAFVGATETVQKIDSDPQNPVYEIFLSGPVKQEFGRNVDGSKQDYVFNLGGNISDFIYIGANLGLTSITYSEDWYLTESAVDQNDFRFETDNGEAMYFQRMKYAEGYMVDGSGIYGKLGIIVTPGQGLRFGAAIQTPTVTTIDETWTVDGETRFSTGKYTSYSPYGTGEYTFNSPMRANFGLAYTFRNLGLISVDYEMADYSQMRYDTNNSDRQHFTDLNNDIRTRFGMSHMLRAGIEVKALPEFAIRAGYTLTTSGEKIDSWGKPVSQKSQTASLGFGYSSKGSFFADAAVQTRMLDDEYFMPYENYTDKPSPEIVNHRSLWKAVFTFGWRF